MFSDIWAPKVYKDIPGSIVSNSSKMREKLSIHYRMDKENVVYSFDGILYSDEDGCATPPCNNMH